MGKSGTTKSKGSKKPSNNGGAKHRRTKRRTLDFDQVHNETRGSMAAKALAERTEYDEDKPGEGQFYCLSCARYFQDGETLDKHNRSKKHKQSIKRLEKDEPWEDSDIMPSDNGPRIGRGAAGPAPVVEATATNAAGVSVLVGGVQPELAPGAAPASSAASASGSSGMVGAAGADTMQD